MTPFSYSTQKRCLDLLGLVGMWFEGMVMAGLPVLTYHQYHCNRGLHGLNWVVSDATEKPPCPSPLPRPLLHPAPRLIPASYIKFLLSMHMAILTIPQGCTYAISQ
jgi:hypothetical protein